MPLIICFTAQYYNEHQLSWGKLRCEPATRWFDESFAPIPKSCERFARQHRYRPPPGFPRASPCSGIVHHLSGPNRHTLTQPHVKAGRCWAFVCAHHRSVDLPFSTRDGTCISSPLRVCLTPWSVLQDGCRHPIFCVKIWAYTRKNSLAILRFFTPQHG